MPNLSSLPVHIPVIRIPQPDGAVLLRAGRPEIQEEYIWTSEAAVILGLSQRHVEAQCALGEFTTAFKPGGRPRSRWKIAKREVLARTQPQDL